MNIAFVASTLPAAFLYKKVEDLNINRIVCENPDLLETYTFLQEMYPRLTIGSLPKSKLKHFFSILLMFRGIERIYFFHECCWPLFDLCLIVTNAKAHWYPQVSMNGFRLVERHELSCWSQLQFHRINDNKFRPFFVAAIMFLKRWFRVYEAHRDGGKGLVRCLSLRTEKFPSIEPFDRPKLVISRDTTIRNPNMRHTVIVTCAREPVDQKALRDLYNKVCQLLDRQGYRIFLKDHPNKTNRLGFDYPGAEILPAHVPVECIDMEYDFMVGVASSSLTKATSRSISVLKLLPFSESVVLSRLATLSALCNFANIIFVNSLEEMKDIITEERFTGPLRDENNL